MEKGSALQRFVECGGWLKVEKLSKPRCAVAWGVAAVWFGVFAVVFSSWGEATLAVWNVALYGQGGLVVAALVIGALEKPVLRTRLIENPEKKPHALY